MFVDEPTSRVALAGVGPEETERMINAIPVVQVGAAPGARRQPLIALFRRAVPSDTPEIPSPGRSRERIRRRAEFEAEVALTQPARPRCRR